MQRSSYGGYSLLPSSCCFQLPASYFLLPASYFLLPASYFLLTAYYLLLTTCPREESLSLAPVRAPVAVQVKVDVEPEAISSNSLHAYCMLTACSLHAHCMLTACLLHAYCMLTACLLQATYGAELSTAGTGPVSVSQGIYGVPCPLIPTGARR